MSTFSKYSDKNKNKNFNSRNFSPNISSLMTDKDAYINFLEN